jgi:hypothetical protein
VCEWKGSNLEDPRLRPLLPDGKSVIEEGEKEMKMGISAIAGLRMYSPARNTV